MPTPSVIQIRIPGKQGPKGGQGDKGDVGDVNPQMPIILQAAEDARDLAQAWASQPQNQDVAGAGPGSRSSFHWSKVSEGHASAVVANKAATETAKDTAVAAAAAAAGVAVGNSYFKAPVKYVTTRHITLSGVQTADGNSTSTGQRIGVARQDNPSQNGIYIANDGGAWTRATDADTAAEISGACFMVEAGQNNRNKLFCMPTSIATLGTDPILFVEQPQGGSVLEIAGMSRQVMCDLGDSNKGGRPSWVAAIYPEFRHERSPFANWTHYNHGVSGYTINGLLDTLANGNKLATPVDANPSVGPVAWDGNIWRLINAFLNADKGGIVRFSLGINDAGLKGGRASYGSAVNFPKNLDLAIYLLLAILPRVGIVMEIPAPFVGEDYIQSGTNETDWAADSPDGTVDGGAAFASEYIRKAYLSWVGRHPRVMVWDSAELFGTRIDDKAVNGQDPEGQGALMDDTLHFTGLAARRINQYVMRLLGQRRQRPTVVTPISNAAMNNAFWGAWFYTGQAGSVVGGVDTRLSFTGSKEGLYLRTELLSKRLNAWLPVPTHILDLMEQALYLGSWGDARRLLTMKQGIAVYFPGSGNTYTPTGVVVGNTQNNTEGYPRFIYDFKGVVMDAADRAADQICFIYATTRAGVPYQALGAQFNADGTAGGGGMHNPYDFDWYPTVFQFQRGVGTNAIDVKIYAQNMGDGRLVDGAINSGTAPGMIVAEGSLSNGVYSNNSLTLNATNWPSGFLFKSNYRLVGRVTSGTLVGQGSFTARA